jgi:hypothetical protein
MIYKIILNFVNLLSNSNNIFNIFKKDIENVIIEDDLRYGFMIPEYKFQLQCEYSSQEQLDVLV